MGEGRSGSSARRSATPLRRTRDRAVPSSVTEGPRRRGLDDRLGGEQARPWISVRDYQQQGYERVPD